MTAVQVAGLPRSTCPQERRIIGILAFDVSPARLSALLATALVAGLARGFSGFGGALIFIPVASAVLGPRAAAPLLLIVDGITTLGLIPGAWRRADRAEVGTMSLGAAVGVPLGTLALARIDAVTLRWGIVGLVASLLVLLASGWRYRGRPAAPLTVGVGGLSGFCSGAAQIGGPPVVAYWLGGADAGPTVRANVLLYFLISTVLTLVSYLAGGLIVTSTLALALPTSPAYGLGLWCGARMFGRASETSFRRICLGLIALAALLGLPLLDGVLR